MKQQGIIIIMLLLIFSSFAFTEEQYDFFITHKQTDDWNTSFSDSLRNMLSREHLSRQTIRIIAEALKEEVPPSDPEKAALMVCDALLYGEVCLRKTIPPHDIKYELRNAWRKSSMNENQFRSRLMKRFGPLDRKRVPHKVAGQNKPDH